MKATVAVSLTAAVALLGVPAIAACPPGQNTGCVSLDGLSQISRDIVAQEQQTAVRKTAAPVGDGDKPYVGPTVGFSKMVRRAPTVGYKWTLE